MNDTQAKWDGILLLTALYIMALLIVSSVLR